MEWRALQDSSTLASSASETRRKLMSCGKRRDERSEEWRALPFGLLDA